MKIVVLNGSPQKKGITSQIVDYVLADIEAEVKKYYAYYDDIKPCVACLYCFSHPNECVIKDDFQKMIADFNDADLIILASPLHFSSMSGQLLSVISRLQYLFALKYEHQQAIPFKDKKGLTIITGGNNYPTMFKAIEPVDSIIYAHTNAKKVERLLIKATDKHPVAELKEIYAQRINEIKAFIKQ